MTINGDQFPNLYFFRLLRVHLCQHQWTTSLWECFHLLHSLLLYSSFSTVCGNLEKIKAVPIMIIPGFLLEESCILVRIFFLSTFDNFFRYTIFYFQWPHETLKIQQLQRPQSPWCPIRFTTTWKVAILSHEVKLKSSFSWHLDSLEKFLKVGSLFVHWIFQRYLKLFRCRLQRDLEIRGLWGFSARSSYQGTQSFHFEFWSHRGFFSWSQNCNQLQAWKHSQMLGNFIR